MSLTVAGIPVNFPTLEVADWINANITTDEIYLFDKRAYPGPNLQYISWPTSFRQLPPVRVGEFRWPTGASRWGSLHLLASTNLTNQIQAAAFGLQGDQYNKVDVYVDSPNVPGQIVKEYIFTDLYMLPPYTLARVPPIGEQTFNSLYLLSFVDDRFFWWGVPTPDFGIPTPSTGQSGGGTWEGLFNKCQTALRTSFPGLTIEFDPISPNYLGPSSALNLEGEVIPPVLDAIATNVGQRIVRGHVKGSNVKSLTCQHSFSIRQADDTNHPNRVVRAGNGDRFLDQL